MRELVSKTHEFPVYDGLASLALLRTLRGSRAPSSFANRWPCYGHVNCCPNSPGQRMGLIPGLSGRLAATATTSMHLVRAPQFKSLTIPRRQSPGEGKNFLSRGARF